MIFFLMWFCFIELFIDFFLKFSTEKVNKKNTSRGKSTLHSEAC